MKPPVPELLFFSSFGNTSDGRLPTPPPSSPSSIGNTKEAKFEPSLTVHALAFSSNLQHHGVDGESTPPASPLPADEEVDAVFLPASFVPAAEIINEPPVLKRKTANGAFNEGSERRRKARRSGGAGVAAAAATSQDSQLPPLKHGRPASQSQPVPLQTRPLSRSPSVVSSRPPTAVAAVSKRSTLSRVQSAAAISEDSKTEAQNKDLISRIVMAGMRLYGLVQSKNRKSRANSAAPSPAVDVNFEELETEHKNDEEYKLVYHQVFKGTCFAFRASINKTSLHLFSDRVRDVVDRLLVIFRSDSLAKDTGSRDDKLTPAGRKAFGADAAPGVQHGFEVRTAEPRSHEALLVNHNRSEDSL